MNCVHHYVIPSPSGPTNDGICKHCGDVRTFHNDATDAASKGMSLKGSNVLMKRAKFPQMTLEDHKDCAYVEGLKGQK